MKTKIIFGLSAVIIVLILAGVIAGLAVKIQHQSTEIACLQADVRKTKQEKESYKKTLEDYRNVEKKYTNQKTTVTHPLPPEAVRDFNRLFDLWLSNDKD